METYFSRLLREGVPDKVESGPIDFRDLFDEYVASTQKVWAHDRSSTVGASEAFGCIRKNWFTKRGSEFGYERDNFYKDSWGAVRRGDLIENYHVEPAMRFGLERRGYSLELSGTGQETIVHDNSSATLDGLAINVPRNVLSKYGVDDIESDCFVLEMKSFDPMISLSEEKAIHRGQAQMQMGLIRNTTKYKPMYAVILYVQASWLDDIRPFIVKWDESVYEVGVKRNNMVFTETDPHKLSPEGKFLNMCDYCPFTAACAAVNEKRVPAKSAPLKKAEVEEQGKWLIDKLGPNIEKAHKLGKKIKEMEIEREQLKEQIKQDLILSNKSRAVGPDWKVSYTQVPGRNTLDRSKMVEAGLDPDEFMSQGNGFEKLTITMS